MSAPRLDARSSGAHLRQVLGPIVGIDPGVQGGIAFYHPLDPASVAAFDTPVVANEVDVDSLVDLIQGRRPSHAIIERVHSFPKQGVSSTFKFGTAYGAVRAAVIALRIPYTLVTPTKWKGHYGLSSDGELSRAMAMRLWPGAGCFARKKDHNRAEAALLARYGADVVLQLQREVA